jgi:hypothetical protein
MRHTRGCVHPGPRELELLALFRARTHGKKF